jgi:Tfp pilus assembly protein FimT
VPCRDSAHRARRPGHTLAELVVALAAAAVLAAAGARAAGHARDGAAVRAAGAELRAAFAAARALAALRGAPAAVRLDSAAGAAAVHAGADTVRRLALRARYGVRLAATRDSMAYAPPGVGRGAANLRAVLTRGAAADTVVVSRLGRIR